jgi:pyrrolidone-carboxylate peptidase
MARMSVDGIRRALVQARQDGKVTPDEVDRIMLAARDAGGLDAAERRELLTAADGFDDATKQRVLTHLAAMGQKNAWVNVEAPGQLASITGRYANLSVGVPGLSARLGLFDNCLGLSGRAKADGVVKLNVEGTAIELRVTKGETAAQILSRVREKLPGQVASVLLRGEVGPYDAARFDGPAARRCDTSAHLMLYKPEALGLEPGEKPLRVVVTGYGAFMGITDNPSADMAQKLAELGVRGAIVEYRRLDVTTDAVDAFIAEMRRAPPDVILSMGVTGGQAQVEERPENRLGAALDGKNQPITARTIRPGGPGELPTDLPVEVIDWALSGFGGDRRVFTSRSDPSYQPDRSAYLCNYLGYHLAAEFGATDATTAGFIHINRETPVEQMHALLEAITARQLEWRRQASRPVS